MSRLKNTFDKLSLQLNKNTNVIGWNMPAEAAILFVKSLNKEVVTFVGYSGRGYENEQRMKDIVQRVLSEYDPKKTIVNIGATVEGVGSIYEWAKDMGFTTTGIVSKVSLEYPGGFADTVDYICFINVQTYTRQEVM